MLLCCSRFRKQYARLLDLGLLLLLLAVERDTCCLLTVEPELLMKINLCCYYEMVGPANRGGVATANSRLMQRRLRLSCCCTAEQKLLLLEGGCCCCWEELHEDVGHFCWTAEEKTSAAGDQTTLLLLDWNGSLVVSWNFCWCSSRPQCWRKGEEVLGAPVCCGELAGHSCRPEEEQMEHWRLTVQLSKTKLTTGCCWTMEEMVVRVVDAAVDYNEGLE